MTVEQYEKMGRAKFRKLIKDNKLMYFVDNPRLKEYYDGVLYYGDKKFLIEIKTRAEKYNQEETLMFEADKYNHLRECATTLSADGAYYVSFFTNDAYIYNVPDNIEYEPINMKANKCTSFSDEKVEKLVYMIPKNKMRHKKINGDC